MSAIRKWQIAITIFVILLVGRILWHLTFGTWDEILRCLLINICGGLGGWFLGEVWRDREKEP